MIKPEFFDDPSIGELSPLARLFFIGLWTQADREGRLIDDQKRLKVRIFPYDNIDPEPIAAELADKDMIRRYADEVGRRYIWIRSFVKHQRPHPKEPPSLIPEWKTLATEKHGQPWKKPASPQSNGTRNLVNGTRNLELKDPPTGGEQLREVSDLTKAGANGSSSKPKKKPEKTQAELLAQKLVNDEALRKRARPFR